MIRSIRLKAVLSISVILGCAFIFLGIYNYQTSRNALRHEIVTSSIPLLRENIYSEIKRQLVPALNVSSVMSHDSFLINWVTRGEKNVPEIIQYLGKIQKEYEYFSTFFVSTQTGRYYHYSGVHKIMSRKDPHDVWYYRFIQSGKKYVLDVDTDEAGNHHLTIFINFRVHDFDGNLIGVTGVGIKMTDFSLFLARRQEHYKRKIYLVNREGMIQAHSDISTVENTSLRESAGIHTIADELLSNMISPVILNYERNDKTMLASSRYIDELDWFLIVEQNETEAMESAHDNLIRTIIVGSVVLFLILCLAIMVVNHFNRKLEQQAASDPLTSANNRREFILQLDRMVQRKKRTDSRLSLLMIDVDLFKQINDTRGHLTGDLVLREIVSRITNLKRPEDILSRLGGDEFTVLIEGGIEIARSMADRIQDSVQKDPFTTTDGRTVSVSLSIGIYEASDTDGAEDILHNADKALYRAKDAGRNRVME